MSVEGGSESPSPNGGDCLLVQALAQSFYDADFLGAAVDANEDADGDVALEFQFAGFVGIRRLRAVLARDRGKHIGIRAGAAFSFATSVAITHAVAVAIADAVSFTGAGRIGIILHPGKAELGDDRNAGRCVWIEDGRRNGQLFLLRLRKTRRNERHGGERCEVAPPRRTRIIIAAATFGAERGLAESGGGKELRHSQLNFGGVYRCKMIYVNRTVRRVQEEENRAKKCGVDDGSIGLGRAVASGEIDIGEMERRAVRGRAHMFGQEKCRAKIVGDAMNPVGVGRIVRGKTGQKPGHG